MHESFARWLEGRDESDDLVGAHLERAALDSSPGPERDARSRDASTRLGRAGARALLAFDHAAAANLLERAAALLDQEDSQRLEFECSLGHSLKGLGAHDRAIDLLTSVAQRARLAEKRRLELRAQVELTLPLIFNGSLTIESAVETLDEAIIVLRDEGDGLGLARAELTYALVLGDWGKRADLATPHLERAEAAYRLLGIVGYTDVTAVDYALSGTTSIEDTTRLCEDSMARHPDRLRRRAYLRGHRAFLLALSGDLEGARAVAALSRLELEELGEDVVLGTSAPRLAGSIEVLCGDWTRAEDFFQLGLEYARDRPAQRSWHAYFLARLGETALGRADPHTAADLAERARVIAVAGDVETEIWWRRVAARALAAISHPRKAVRLGREAVDIADGIDGLLMQGEARLDLAEVLFRVGSRAQAAAVTREGLALLDLKRAVLSAANGRSRFADLLAGAAGGGTAAAAPPSRVL